MWDFFIQISDVVVMNYLVVIPPLEDGVNGVGHELLVKVEEIYSEQHCKGACCAAKCDEGDFNEFFHCYFSFLTMHSHRAGTREWDPEALHA